MTLPFSLPDWVPWWVPMVLLVPTLLYALAFLFMPFSVLGVKSRLESIEARLDDLQHELRMFTSGIPVGRQEMDFEDLYAPVAAPAGRQTRQEPVISDRPPVPPAAPSPGLSTGPSPGSPEGSPAGPPNVTSPNFVPPNYYEDDEPIERPAPSPHARPPARRQESPPPGLGPSRGPRSEPRLDKRW